MWIIVITSIWMDVYYWKRINFEFDYNTLYGFLIFNTSSKCDFLMRLVIEIRLVLLRLIKVNIFQIY